ncbi:hypothetical protein IJG14_05630 [bacterium]|nr:hypothetical protein [bacterium]
MKKILIYTLIIALCPIECYAENFNYNRYQTTNGQKIEFTQSYNQKISQQDTIFNQEETSIEEDNNVELSVISKFEITKELKNKYKSISNNPKIIEACELLKNGAGNFSYQSIHGKNKTSSPVAIVFANFTKNKEHENTDAYGEYTGKKYQIKINSKFQDAPAAALAPLLAREALISKNKNEDDIEMAEQLQIAIWTQMLQKYPYLEGSQNDLVKMENKLKNDGKIQEYGSFLGNENITKEEKKYKQKKIKGQALQEAFDVEKQEKGDKIASEILSYDSKVLEKKYKKVTKEDRIMEALELLKDSVGKFSHDAILGNNVTHKPITIKFKNLEEINPKYSTFDALGWRQAGKLNIFINAKHADAPAAALAAILAHEALHQDEYDSLNEETYAWTMEASVWTQMCDKNPEVSDIAHPLVTRENLLKKLLEKGNYTNKYLKKSVFSNPSYSNLPVRSPGFEDDI